MRSKKFLLFILILSLYPALFAYPIKEWMDPFPQHTLQISKIHVHQVHLTLITLKH